MVLTTIHSAKGLEFDNVYYFHSHDWYRNYDLEQTEEDRRLFYVGISRAKNKLYVFDHTDIERPFESILKDFDKVDMTGMASDMDEEAPDTGAQEVDQKTSEVKEVKNVIQVDFVKRGRK